MNNSQKLENLLNLALDAAPAERERSQVLNLGYAEDTGRWELIVRYHGSADAMRTLPDTRVETLLGGYAVVWTPQEQIEILAALPEVEYIEKPKQLLYEVTAVKTVSCIDQLQQSGAAGSLYGTPGGNSSGVLGQEIFGRGVLVAVLDSGIDYTLPDFQNADGSSRIVGLWDQTLGQEFTKEQIDEALFTAADRHMPEAGYRLVPSRDFSGHGTAVAGVAAGSGQHFRGVAPESDLLIVKLRNTGRKGISPDNRTDEGA